MHRYISLFYMFIILMPLNKINSYSYVTDRALALSPKETGLWISPGS